MIIFVTIILLGCSVAGIYYTEFIFGARNVSTIGMAACILILANLVAWPNILDRIRDEKNMFKIENERGRAEVFIN